MPRSKQPAESAARESAEIPVARPVEAEAELTIEQRHYTRENRMLMHNRKSLVLQERMYFRNIPLSDWIEHEIVMEEGQDSAAGAGYDHLRPGSCQYRGLLAAQAPGLTETGFYTESIIYKSRVQLIVGFNAVLMRNPARPPSKLLEKIVRY